ncbi:hypothetical protein CRM22_008984 [Opisthorchis felineus]|uniref:Uncharacterized protein n=1 Tax=Opisthorchis felineus TaxID=147828 RepID=A0A4S2LGM9_OPIFE|nr:hypothetical protein CRM22_008984 [Opisthorchis felineus]
MKVQLLFLSDCHQNKKNSTLFDAQLSFKPCCLSSFSHPPYLHDRFVHCFGTIGFVDFSHIVFLPPFFSLKSFLNTGLLGCMNLGEDRGTIISMSAFFLNLITLHPPQLTHPATTICHLGLLTVVVTTALFAGRVYFFCITTNIVLTLSVQR